jgi:hypothetical protein
VAREGGQGFVFYIYVEGGWEGEGVDFFLLLSGRGWRLMFFFSFI